MNRSIILLFIALSCSCVLIQSARTVNSHLGTNDLTRLQKVFAEGLASNDLQSIYYATLNIESKNSGDKQSLCDRVRKAFDESKLNVSEKDFYLVGAHKQLSCSSKLPEDVSKRVKDAFKTEMATAQEIYYRVLSQKLLGVTIDETTITKIIKSLQELLKKDDSLGNLGYAFNVAVELKGNNAATFIVERVEDAIAQADEVDGKMLQFEGGLSITALVINGAFRVSKVYKKPLPINAEQAVKFSNYLLSRRSVQTAKGAHLLIEALKTIAEVPEIAPICVQIIGNGQLEASTPALSIAIVDLLGKSAAIKKDNVFGKVLLKKDNSVLAEKVAIVSKSSDKTTFVADLSSYKPTRGIYTIDVTIDTVYTQKLQFKILGRVKVHSLEVGVAEFDASSAAKKQTVSFPSKLSEPIVADHTQKLSLKAVLVDEATAKVITVHQAFVRLYNKEADQEIIFVAEQDSSKAYKFDIDVGARSGDFGHKSGPYEMYFIVGDASLSNSFQWYVADAELKFAQDAKDVKKQPIREPLPEIIHQFRVPEKRPPRIVSDVFTGLCLTPLVLLFIFWGKLGINVSNFNLSPSTLGFHLGFGGILTLFATFWLQLDMFQTLRLLIPIAIFTFLCGNRLLRRIYAQRVGKAAASSTTASSSDHHK